MGSSCLSYRKENKFNHILGHNLLAVLPLVWYNFYQ